MSERRAPSVADAVLVAAVCSAPALIVSRSRREPSVFENSRRRDHTVNASEAEVLAALAETGKSVMVRAATAETASSEIIAWATERDRKVVDVSPFYGNDLRGSRSVGGDPLVSGPAAPSWVLDVVEHEGPHLLLLPDVVAASAAMSTTNISVLRDLLQDRRLPGGNLAGDCLVVATASFEDGSLPGLSGDALAHIKLS